MIFRNSITWRLTLIFAALSTTVLIAVGAIASLSVENHFAEEDMEEINGKLELIQNTFDKTSTAADMKSLPQKLNDALVGHHALLVTVYEPSGKVIYATHDADFPKDLLETAPAHYKTKYATLRKWTLSQRSYRGLSVQMDTTRELAAPLNVAIALNTEHHQIFIQRFQQSLWASLFTGVLITIVLGWIAVKRGLAPVRDFDKIASRVSASRLDERIPVEVLPNELVALGLSFNGMLQRLEDSFQRLSDFSSDIAHELRTPVSNLMTQTQVAVSKSRTTDEYKEILYSNLEEYDRLSRMISDMLFLAKADNGLIFPNKEKVDLAQEVQVVIDFFEPVADEKNVKILCTGNASIVGDKLMMRRAISNLLSNAIRHTDENQQININIEMMESKQTRLTIENPCEPISQEHLTKIFDRFYRIDPSRQRNSEGSGLGLAITKSIIESHGGVISATSGQGVIRLEMVI
jgi:two-component system heavy metal sensor histidine kinase CusS